MSAPAPMIEEEASAYLHQVWFVLKEQRQVLTGGVILGILLGALLFLLQPRVYESHSQFIINDLPFKLSADKSIDGSVSQLFVQSLIKSIPSTEMQSYVAERLQVPEANIAFIDLRPPLSLRLPQQANIKVENPRESRIGEVTADASSPEFAAEVVNTVTEKFQQLNVIAGHITDLESKISYSQAQVAKLGDQLVLASGERIRLSREKLALDAYLSRGQSIENFPVFASDYTLNTLKTRLVQVQSDYDSLASYSVRGKTLAGSEAELKGIETQIQSYAGALGEALRASYDIATAQEKDLQANIDVEQKNINQWQREMARYSEAIGDLRLRSTLIGMNNDGSEVKQASVVVLMEKGQPIKRLKSPRLGLSLAIGLTLGLGLGLSGAFVVHTLDRRVKLPTQIETLTQVRCLAVITSESETIENGLHISKTPRGLYYLRSQLLRAAITGNNDRIFSFTGLNSDSDVIKTVAHLAVLMAETEKKTLVVDLFFHTPQMCKELGIVPKSSLNRWLYSDEDLAKFINVTAVRELAVLDSQKSEDVVEDMISRRPLIPSLESMKNSWDFILIAAPPLLEVSHLLFAAPLGSPVIGVAEYEKSSLDDVKQLKEYCAVEGLKFSGVVLNNYPQENIMGQEIVFGLGGHRYLFDTPESPQPA